MKTGKAIGTVFHNRMKPAMHQFRYKMHWHLIDLQTMSEWSGLSVKHRYNGWSLYAIFDEDYVNADAGTIEEKIQQYLVSQGITESEQIILMTHPRYLGFAFNSVSFYFCYCQGDLIAIVSEINNTPWGEKQLYCHDTRDMKDAHSLVFRFNKQFHISPFIPMDVNYIWTFDVSDEAIHVDMKLMREDSLIMRVNLNTKVEAATTPSKFDFGVGQTVKMWSAIYWQALKLWLKKVPFYAHPKSTGNNDRRYSGK